MWRRKSRRPVWRFGPTVRTEASGGWHGVEATVEGQPLRFESLGARPWEGVESPITAMVPLALAAGADIATDQPVDAGWRENLGAATRMLGGWIGAPGEFTLRAPIAPGSAVSPGADGAGLCFTGGVDSFWSLLRGGDRPTHLMFVVGFDVPLAEHELIAAQVDSLRTIAEASSLDVRLVRTNLRSHPAKRHLRWRFHHGAALAAAGIASSDVLGRLTIPPSHPTKAGIPWGSHPELDPLWSLPGRLRIEHGATDLTRYERVLAIAHDPLAQQHLRVCWQRLGPGMNCGRCEKCLRTMTMLAAAGTLDAFTTFPRGDLAGAITDLITSGKRPVPPRVLPHWQELSQAPLPGDISASIDLLVEDLKTRLPR